MTDGDHQFFESGGILLHWSRKDVRLLPTEYPARLCVINWLLGAFNSFEPFTIQTATVDIFAKDEECAKLRRPDTRRLCYAL